jgi:hypothetical protein
VPREAVAKVRPWKHTLGHLGGGEVGNGPVESSCKCK